MPYIYSNDNETIYISEESINQVGGFLKTIDTNGEILLTFDSKHLRLLVEYRESIL